MFPEKKNGILVHLQDNEHTTVTCMITLVFGCKSSNLAIGIQMYNYYF